MEEARPTPHRTVRLTERPPKAPLERRMRRSVAPLTADEFLAIAEHVRAWRREAPARTQAVAARHFDVPLRQIKLYEAAARWSPEAKAYARENASQLSTRALHHLAKRAWSSSEVLINAMRRHVAGKPPRSRVSTKASAATAPKDPDVLALEDRLRERLMTRVALQFSPNDPNRGTIQVEWFSLAELERLLELMGVS